MNSSFHYFCKRLARELAGIRFEWIDEYVGEYEVSCFTTFIGTIDRERLTYTMQKDIWGSTYHRDIDSIAPEEHLFNAEVRRTLLGPKILMHSRIYE